jgi:superfamily I DNA/RNA helicase
MQGLNAQGISSWDELRKAKILPNLEVKSLDISYRQLPTLLDMAKEMYKDDQKVYPSYQSDFQKDEKEPVPLLFVSDDEDEKAEWIADRIRDIFRTYNELPSVAIFVGDEVNIEEFIERINDLDMLDGIELKDCSGDREIQSKDMVRVFRLSEVKGMEFEAVFFYDIDTTLRKHSLSMMRRFLYVGISRAASHLAATITSTEGQEGIMKYFNMDVKTW